MTCSKGSPSGPARPWRGRWSSRRRLARRRCGPSTCWRRCWPTPVRWPHACSAGWALRVERVGSELDARRTQYVDGLDQDDAEALQAIGIDLDAVVRRVETHLGGLPAPRRRRPRMSRSAKKVLELSLREAVALRHNYIGTEHLLLALARTDDRVVADTLAAVGVDRPALRAAVAEAVRRAS